MSDIVIKAENLGKKYVIGHQAESLRGPPSSPLVPIKLD
jgi:hypothetical protein